MSHAFGYIRFSFFGRNDTKLNREAVDEEARFNALYAPARMRDRFYYFENVTLPSIRAQIDKDFKIFVISSEIMPQEYKDRLNQITSDIPQIEVVYSSARDIATELNPRISDLTAGLKEKSAHFRLDDDDAICAQMIGLLKTMAAESVSYELVHFPRGFFLAMNGNEPQLLRKFEPYIAIGWAYINKPGQARSPYHGVHNNMHHYVPTMLNPLPHAYIHVSHESSDTVMNRGRKLKAATKQDPRFNSPEEMRKIDKQLAEFFPSFNADQLRHIISHSPSQLALVE